MQGQIIRVKGTFSRADLPKLSDLDTSFLLQEILNHPACTHFYDFTDVSKMKLDGSNITEVVDLKNGESFLATNNLPPVFSTTSLAGKAGTVFNGAHEGSIANLFATGETVGTLDIGCQLLLADSSNMFVASRKTDNKTSIYYTAASLRANNGNGRIVWGDRVYKANRIVNTFNFNSDVTLKGELFLNDTTETNGTSLPFGSPVGDWNVGRWSDEKADAYGNFVLGHIATFTINVTENEYLNGLLREYSLRKYK